LQVRNIYLAEEAMRNRQRLRLVPGSAYFSFVLILTVILIAPSPPLAYAAGGDAKRYQGSGILTAVENDSNVTIDGKGYDVARSVLAENLLGRPTPLAGLPVPAHVNFEYSYMQTAPKTMVPVIVYIKITRKPVGGGGYLQ